ncbi:kinesin-II 85 kDa subunit-like isoform X1 [Rhopilema esculentum]|uniref:kinesin-II 85 kDa subunit-like isoform X1 n=1 Tax=Rhopilema esculentum TaxID=499914 RepID=UPI0031D588FB
MEAKKDEHSKDRLIQPVNSNEESTAGSSRTSAIPLAKNSKRQGSVAKGDKESEPLKIQETSEKDKESATIKPGGLPNSTQSESKRTGGKNSSNSSAKNVSRTSSATDLENASSNSIKVVVRVRPINALELRKEEKASIEFPEDGVIWVNAQGNTKPFTFNEVFQDKASQPEIFNQCGIKGLIEKALDGFSCTAFAFGQTGSGKTYTITGPYNPEANEVLPSEELYGLIPRSFEFLLSQVRQREENSTLKAAYLEVYNEKVKDLLNPSTARESLPVRWSSTKGFYVENLFMMECETLEDFMAVLEEGLENRKVGGHAMNDHSSRSHTMLTVYIDSEIIDPEDDLSVIRQGKISFVDLAGNERVKETKATGEALTESQNINKSLLTLGNCIAALGDPKKRGGHIPYRDSKLTKLLADSIGGEGYTLMIACVSPSSTALQDTLNTLRYANRAKNIKNKPVVKMDPREQLIISMKREMKLLKAENAYFRQQLNIPCSDSQVVITPEQIQGVMSADENSGSLSPAIGTKTYSSLESSSRNSLSEVKSEETVPRATTAMYAMTASIGLYDMLQEYINENETLRQQNFDLFKKRKEVEREYELLSMKNDSLSQKLGNIERALSSTSLSTRSDSEDTLTDSRHDRRPSLHDFQKEAGFNLTFPPLRSGTYPNIISADVDLAAEVEREHRKIKEERARKQREKEMQEKKMEQERDSPEEEHSRTAAEIAFKTEEGKSIGSPVTKKRDTNVSAEKEQMDKQDQALASNKTAKWNFKLKAAAKKRPNVERERGQNSYAAKFAVRKGIGPTSSYQQSLQRDSNEKQTTSKDYFLQSSQDFSPYQAQNSDFEPIIIGGSPRLLINDSHTMNDQLRIELEQLEGQIQKEFAFKQSHKPAYHGR